MARNLSLHITLSTLPTSGTCFLLLAVSHLSAYYFLVLQPMFSDDPMLCSTCLEIRSLALASSIPVVMGGSAAVLANLSACLMNKTLRLPRFNIQAYPEWKHFFRRHAFKGMTQRYFVAYPLLNGFLASMVFLGQYYYWKNDLRPRFQALEKQGLPVQEPRKRSRLLGPVQDFFAKISGGKMK